MEDNKKKNEQLEKLAELIASIPEGKREAVTLHLLGVVQGALISQKPADQQSA